MKIKDGFVLREAGGSFIIVPTGSARVDFNGMISLNGTGAFIWRTIESGSGREAIVAALAARYEVDESKAEEDAEYFFAKLREANLVEE